MIRTKMKKNRLKKRYLQIQTNIEALDIMYKFNLSLI